MIEQSPNHATPVGWLRAQIDECIESARQSLARALARRAERKACLLHGAHQIHRVRGALDVLGLEGASRFCRTLEEAMRGAADDKPGYGEAAASALDRALFALRQFLADISQGVPEVPLKLFPLYKEVAELCGRVPSEVELFFPDLEGAAIVLDGRASTLHPSTRPAHIAACSTLFRRGLVAWLKQPSHEAIGMLRSALDGMHRACDGTESHPGLWWVGGGLLDVLASPDARIDSAQAKATLRRLERTLRAVSDGTVSDCETLMREMLYPIAVAQPVTERVRDIKERYLLDAHIPEYCVSGTLEYDVRVLAPVLEEMRTLLAGIEQAWSSYAAGTLASLPALRGGLAKLKSTARDLGHYRLVRLLDIVIIIVSKLPESSPLTNEGLSLEMATVLLFMEGMLDHFTDPPHDIDQQVAVMGGWLLDAAKSRTLRRAMSGTPRDDVTQRQHVADIRAQVVGEIQENLLRAEQIIEQVARNEAPVERIGATERAFGQVAGALKMLGLNRANGVLSACVHLLRLCAAGEPELKETTLPWAADGLSCLGFYLEAQRRGMPPNENLLLDFVRRLANETEAPAGSTGWIPAAIDPNELSQIEDERLPENLLEPAASGSPAFEEETHAATLGDEGTPSTLDPVAEHEAGDDAAAPLEPHAAHADAEAPDSLATPPAEKEAVVRPSEVHDGAPPTPADDAPDISLLPVFLDEARILLGRLYADLGVWRSAPRDVRSARAFTRTLHTLKGSARLIGAMGLGDFTHSVESCVGEAIERGEHEGDAFDFAPLQHMLSAIAQQIGALETLRDRVAASSETQRTALPNAPVHADVLDAPSTVRLPIATLNGLINHAGELSEVRARTEDETGALRRSLHELAEAVARMRAQLSEMDQATARLVRSTEDPRADGDAESMAQGIRLQELNRAMAETLHDIQALQRGLVVSCAETEAALALQGRLDRSLRHKLLEVRRLPFGSLTERLQRTVRQTASQLGREAVLQIEGQNIPIDRTVLQRLAAPLEHMLRNAVAHGIETPARRLAASKSAVGTIRLVIEQNDDENVLSLADDGAGLDLQQIRAQAVQLGLVRPEDELPERMLFSLIFAPGLSTAGTVTAAAGRGIGLDVVRAEVRAMGGSIEVTSTPTRGVCFRIRFPTSLSYTQALLVRSGGALYAIPATVVEQVCELSADELLAARKTGRLAAQDHDYRFVDLAQLLGHRNTPAAPRRSNSVLLLHGDAEHYAVHVEQVLRKQAIELKNIGPQLARVRGIAGATIVGKGEVVLILDPEELVMHGASRNAHQARRSEDGVAESPRVVLVVDDSLTMRTATARLLSGAGYRVLVAKDGCDALQQVEETLPDLVIADIDMPNMDGFELTARLRGAPRTERIPVVIVTSRIAEQHQKRAADLGVEIFFGKPYAEEKLLADVAELLDRRSQEAAA